MGVKAGRGLVAFFFLFLFFFNIKRSMSGICAAAAKRPSYECLSKNMYFYGGGRGHC